MFLPAWHIYNAHGFYRPLLFRPARDRHLDRVSDESAVAARSFHFFSSQLIISPFPGLSLVGLSPYRPFRNVWSVARTGLGCNTTDNKFSFSSPLGLASVVPSAFHRSEHRISLIMYVLIINLQLHRCCSLSLSLSGRCHTSRDNAFGYRSN